MQFRACFHINPGATSAHTSDAYLHLLTMCSRRAVIDLLLPFQTGAETTHWCVLGQELMTNPASPIADFYPTTFAVDMEGKRAEWEGVVLICFIDEKRLLAAEASIPQARLTSEERARNRLGDILIFSLDESLKDGAHTVFMLPQFHATLEHMSVMQRVHLIFCRIFFL